MLCFWNDVQQLQIALIRVEAIFIVAIKGVDSKWGIWIYKEK